MCVVFEQKIMKQKAFCGK